MDLPVLYKIAGNGRKVLVWQVHVNDASYTVTTGYTDGKKQSFTTHIKDMKNSNSLEEQAMREAKSAWDLKRKTMYPSIEEARQAYHNRMTASGGYAPMLAEGFNPKRLKFSINNCYVQPKLDGIRILARKVDGEVRLYSRTGAVKDTTPHINEALREVMRDGEVWDGEIYRHGMEFEDIVSRTQSSKNRKDTSDLQYYIYDCPILTPHTEQTPYARRFGALRARLLNTDFEELQLTPTVRAASFAEIEQFHRRVVDDGYEGAIIRNPAAPYESKRSPHLLKFKKFQDAEFPIVAVNEGSGKLEGHAGSFTCQMPDGRTFDVKMSGEMRGLEHYLKNPEAVIGKMLTVQFFSRTKHGIPRFPVGIRIRED